MSNQLTEEQWNRVWEKWKNLMFSISYRIGGDNICNSIEDSVQELSITAMDACHAYEKKTGETFEEYIETSNFNKYIKTCLWNRKNNNGLKIEKKRAINRHCSLDEQIAETNTTAQSEVCPVSALVEDVCLTDELKAVRDLLLTDQDMIKPNGRINISRLSEHIGKSKQQTKKALATLEEQYKDFEEMNDV